MIEVSLHQKVETSPSPCVYAALLDITAKFRETSSIRVRLKSLKPLFCGKKLSGLEILAIALLLTICSIGSAHALDKHAPLRSFGSQLWTTENGLPQNTVHSIAQTEDGYIWLATDAGLVRFNATEFVVFNRANTPEFKSDRVRHLFRDASSNLWISTAAGLLRLDREGFHRFGVGSALLDDDVSLVTQDPNGSLWIVTATGVTRFQGGRFESFPLPNASALSFAKDGSTWVAAGDALAHIQNGALREKLPSSAIAALCTDSAGSVWVGTRNGVDVITSAGTASPVPGTKDVRGVSSMLCDRAGHVWVASTGGLALFDHGSHTDLTQQLPGKRIDSLHEDAAGAVWINTDRGLVRWVDGRFGDSLSDERHHHALLAMFDDLEGDLWLATEADGLEVLRQRKFTALAASDGLADDRVSAVYQQKSGTIWIGTKGAGLSARQNGKFRTYDSSNGLSSNVILSLAGDQEGRLWIGTPDGLNLFDRGRFSLVTSADGLADDFVRSIYQDPAGTMWVGTRRGLSRFAHGHFTNYSMADGLPSDLIGAVLQDHAHDLWIGTLKGLSRLRDNRFTNYSAAQGLHSDAVTSLHEDSRGHLWIGTDGGLHRLAEDKIFSYSAEPRLPETIYAIVEDAAGYLWLASPQGVFRAALKDLDAVAEGTSSHLAVTRYGTADGMPTRECVSGAHPAAWRMQDGSLWFSTLKGIAAVDPQTMATNSLPPPVAIEKIFVDEVSAPVKNSQVISAGRSRFSFQYAAMSYVAAEKIRFKYKLDGVDRDWVETMERRSASYANLRPGTYTFHVIAANNDGVWNSTGAEVSFRLQPAFYQTIWFYLVFALCTAFLIYEIYRLRIRYVRLRFKAVLEERQRIAREIHDTLAQSMIGVSVQLEIVSRLLASAPDAARQQLDQTRTLVREGIADARRSIWNLRAGADEQSLPSALAAFVTRVSPDTPAKIVLNITGTYHPLPKHVEEELLKITQEATANAIRHAQAKLIDIELFFGSTVRLSVRDDGQGFVASGPAHDLSERYGLTGMRERAKKLKAVLTIDTSPGRGTEVAVEADARELEALKS